MSYIEFDSKLNTLSVVRGDTKYKDGSKEERVNDTPVSLIKRRGSVVGAKIDNCLTSIELQGFRAEEIFKEMLVANEIPSLYVGQGPSGIEYSKPLKKKLNSNRPDFLVNFQDIGSLFFDVKCRKKIGLNSEKKPYFYLFKSEADQLLNLHESLLIPVWVAFYDQEFLVSSKRKPAYNFSLLPISLYKKLRDGIKARSSNEDYQLMSTFRIPSELLTEIEGELNFSVGLNSISEELLDKVAISYRGMIRRIKDEIKNLIRAEKVVKSHVNQKLLSGSLSSSFKVEIDACLDSLIKDGTIIFEKRKPLKLSGE